MTTLQTTLAGSQNLFTDAPITTPANPAKPVVFMYPNTLKSSYDQLHKTHALNESRAAQFEMVTPEMATDWLKQNTKNRHMRQWWVSALAGAIKRGEYVCTHQGVAFNTSGMLIDGQHRLAAIVESGIAVEMLVVNGIPDEAFGVIDCGVKRTLPDLTGLPKKTAEAARLIASITFGGTITSPQVMEVAKAGVADIHEALETYSKCAMRNYSSAPIRAAAVLLMMDGHLESLVGQAYARFMRRDFAEMTPAQHAFVRQVEEGKFNTSNTRDAFSRALRALDPLKSQLTKIQINEHSIEADVAWARSLVKKALVLK